jgi:hypothetical protein
MQICVGYKWDSWLRRWMMDQGKLHVFARDIKRMIWFESDEQIQWFWHAPGGQDGAETDDGLSLSEI